MHALTSKLFASTRYTKLPKKTCEQPKLPYEVLVAPVVIECLAELRVVGNYLAEVQASKQPVHKDLLQGARRGATVARHCAVQRCT